AIHRVVVERDLAMPTREGVTLYADVYRPDTSGRFPVLVVRTPYDKSQDMALTEKDYFPSRGYVVVVQDTRGRFRSEGEFYPFIHEAQDGYDTIEWAAGLPWSDGNVGTVGQSYLGLVQYFAAPQRPPHLKAMSPVSGPVTYFENCTYRRGVFELGWMLAYFTFMARNTLERKGLYEQQRPILDSYLSHPEVPISPFKKEVYRHLPLRDWGERLKDGAPYFADFLRHPTDGPYWQATDLRRQLHDVNVPMFHVGSWYDAFQYDTLTLFTGLRERALTPGARHSQKLLMGPWGHLLPYAVPTSRGTGDIDFGPEALMELHALQLRWFDHFLKGVNNGILDEAPIRLFVMGDNRWRDENEWPLARTQYTKAYLHSDGKANSLRGNGRLLLAVPGEEQPDHYIYDPQDPVPTRGGTTLGLALGVFDQTKIEERDDVLVYTSDVLPTDLEITGPIALKLFAASSAPDTDFTAKLVDVRPDGYAQNIAEGVIRARFRESLTSPTLITPEKIYEYAIDLWATSQVFKAGHRLRLEVSSSNFPRYDRNPNTGHDFGMDTELRTAQQTIFHDHRYPSHLIMPVIPR
ncbi:MAG TPA: CocE/NonD family hydrolase, partial [Candidatus Binatia bacterium]|nr:CocE/NonD family hydrolase [Candidatus Binatia bacterium]